MSDASYFRALARLEPHGLVAAVSARLIHRAPKALYVEVELVDGSAACKWLPGKFAQFPQGEGLKLVRWLAEKERIATR